MAGDGGNGRVAGPAGRSYCYPERATFLKPEEQEEFGVGTVHELVALLNCAWAGEGRMPLAPGSFPTSRVRIRFVLSEARLARQRGSLDRVGVDC
jgi:hypothetical protein